MQNGVKVFLINTLSLSSLFKLIFVWKCVCVWGGGGGVIKKAPIEQGNVDN